MGAAHAMRRHESGSEKTHIWGDGDRCTKVGCATLEMRPEVIELVTHIGIGVQDEKRTTESEEIQEQAILERKT